jgi:endonuclease/exonuclease/phosphatase family metal-dependent hydrolase
MRIVGYNILKGGEGRADPIAEVLLAQKPDIVGLVEADDPAVLKRISGRLKMDFIHATAGRSAAAILSRFPMRETIDHVAGEKRTVKSLLEATIVEPNGTEWIVGAVHLSAGAYEKDETQREDETAFVLDRFAVHRAANRRHLLLGDFNANSPMQRIDPDQCKPATREAWQANGGQIPRRAMQKLFDAGYSDALAAFDSAKAGSVGSFTTQYPGQRIDYVLMFGFSPATIQSAWIEQDRLARYASDHFPVGVEIHG